MDPSGAELAPPALRRLAARLRGPDLENPEVAAAFAATGGPPPLAPAEVLVDLEGLPAEAANALRRVVRGELPGWRLELPAGGYDWKRSRAEFALAPRVGELRVPLVPLRAGLRADEAADVGLRLEAANPGGAPRAVTAGELRYDPPGSAPALPLFNPGAVLAVLYPGETLVLEGIRVVADTHETPPRGRIHPRGALAVSLPLDLPRHPRARTHGGQAGEDPEAYQAAYDPPMSRAEPRAFRVCATIPAFYAGGGLADARLLYVEAAQQIADRLRVALAALRPGAAGAGDGGDAGDADGADGPARLEVGPPPPGGAAIIDGEVPPAGAPAGADPAGPGVWAVLRLEGETDTVGQLIARYVYELDRARHAPADRAVRFVAARAERTGGGGGGQVVSLLAAGDPAAPADAAAAVALLAAGAAEARQAFIRLAAEIRDAELAPWPADYDEVRGV